MRTDDTAWRRSLLYNIIRSWCTDFALRCDSAHLQCCNAPSQHISFPELSLPLRSTPPTPPPKPPTPGVALPFYPGFTCNSALLARGETAAPMRAQVQPLCKLTRKKAAWIEWQTRRWWHIPRRAQSMCHYSMPVKLSVKQLCAISHVCMHVFFFFVPLIQYATCLAIKSSKTHLNPRVDNAEMNHFKRGGWGMKLWNIICGWNSMHVASVSGPDLLSPHLHGLLYRPLAQLKLNSEEKKVTLLSENAFWQEASFWVRLIAAE